MAKQLCYDDVEVGTEVTSLAKIATTRTLVQWAGATGDWYPLHYESDFAKAQGTGEPIIHGELKLAWMIQMMVDWLGEQGRLKKLSCRFYGVDYPRKMKTLDEPKEGETWWCKGRVVKKYTQDNENFVECEIWVENGKGETTTRGAAVAILPPRSK